MNSINRNRIAVHTENDVLGLLPSKNLVNSSLKPKLALNDRTNKKSPSAANKIHQKLTAGQHSLKKAVTNNRTPFGNRNEQTPVSVKPTKIIQVKSNLKFFVDDADDVDYCSHTKCDESYFKNPQLERECNEMYESILNIPIAFEAPPETFDLDAMRIADEEVFKLADFDVSSFSDLVSNEYNDLDDEISLHNQDFDEFNHNFLGDLQLLSPLPELDESLVDFE